MKYKFLHIIYLSVLCSCMVACNVLEEPEVPPCNEDNAEIVFTLALESPMSSRNSWDPGDTNYNPQFIGNNKDNRIVPKQLHVVLYNKDNTYLCKVINLVYRKVPVSGSTISNIYQFVGDVPANVLSADNKLECKIMVFANVPESDIPNAAVSTLENIDFSYSTENIPMWGVASFIDDTTTTDTYEGLTLTPGTRTDIGTIYILRAMAKIKVKLDSKLTNYSLNSVKINRYNTKGYVLPFGYAKANVTTALPLYTEGATTGVLRPNTTDTSSGSLNFTQSEDNDGSFTIYVPEYQNIGVDYPSKMTVTLADPNDATKKEEYPLEFKWYKAEEGKHAENEPFDLIRNHYYEYTITGVSTDLSANLKVIAQEWTTDTESWNYTEVVTVERNMTWTSSTPTDTDENVTVVYEETKNDNDEILTKVPTVYIPWATSTDYATCTFKITAPVGATWIASFEPIEGTVGAFKFLNENNEQVSQMTGKVGTDATLKIVTALSDRTETRKARLHIAVRTWDERIIRVDNLIAEQGITEKEFTLVQPKNN